MGNIFDSIDSPKDLQSLTTEQLEQLTEQMREFITHSVSQTGGHLASNLGVIELTLALHRVFDFKTDHLLWDVGHQCYAHKILTGRKHLFEKLRTVGGISGFPNPVESDYDRFTVGHAGTAIATALGMALGAQQKKSDEKIVAVVGDASIVNGTSFEALNNLGLVKRQMLIVLNDNSMAIDVTKGAIAEFLAKVRLNHTYEDLRKTTHNILTHMPLIGTHMDHALESFKKTLRMALTRSRLFESLNIPYFGPVDGHDVGTLVELFDALEKLNTPAILHVYTKKGHGFEPADDNPRKFHSTGPFEINGTKASFVASDRSFTASFSDALVDLADQDDRICTITAAMPDGTGLIRFREQFPDRYFDVGIAEGVAVDIAAGMAKQGQKPFVCIYSTFLQRSYDHIFQEVDLQNLPVIFCVDRAGLVGSDGPTHHGTLDIGFLRSLPNMLLTAPASEADLKAALKFAADCGRPISVRYPRDVVTRDTRLEEMFAQPYELGKGIWLKHTDADIVLVSLGSMTINAHQAAELLEAENIQADVFNARFVKPIDPVLVEMLAAGKTLITLEDHFLPCGFGSALMEAWCTCQAQNPNRIHMPGRIIPLSLGHSYIRHDTRKAQLDDAGLSPEKIRLLVTESVNQFSKPHVEDIC